ncbi:hypothetical protein GM418_10120 [Maribellus comscasis]|uniref:Uncharacterized protein n=1 Tax=Maribellus comscasis TaxID=2681766 RepID=A0A6I6JRZ1_9BACT|nr:hypothetical protein [Maribellus comscasis]QGY43999.1 hypothetical protein GM418_10120 [Maribellus comscasis]
MKMEKSGPAKKSSVKNGNGQNSDSKFELIRCERNGVRCKSHLAFINEEYSISETYLQNKEYQKSIEALNEAFYRTYQLKETTCINCAKMFRSTIIRSLEDIQIELKGMSQGLFKTRRYQSSYILAGDVLKSIKEEAKVS